MARRRDYKSQPVLTPFPHSPLYFITNNRFPSQVMACAVIANPNVKSHLWRHKNAKKDRNFESQSICSVRTRFQELFKTWAASFWLFSKLTVREHCECLCVCVSVCVCTYETLVTRSVVTVGGVYDSGSHVSRVTQLERGGTGKKRSELFWSLNCLTPFTSNMVGACIKRLADDIHHYGSHSTHS